VFLFVTFLYTIIIGVLWAGLYKYSSSKNKMMQKLQDFFTGERDAPIPTQFTRQLQKTGESLKDSIFEFFKSSTESTARVFADAAKEIFYTLVEKSGLPAILNTALITSFGLIISRILYTGFIRKNSLGFCEAILQLISFSITFSIIFQIHYLDRDILQRRTIQYFAVFIIFISLSTILSRWMFGMCIGLIIDPQKNKLTEIYQILMPSDTWKDESKTKAYLEMRKALLEAHNQVYERPVTRAMTKEGSQPVVTITPPKKTVKKRYTSLSHVNIKTRNVFIKLFGWILKGAGSLFGTTYNIDQLEKNANELATENIEEEPEGRESILLLDNET